MIALIVVLGVIDVVLLWRAGVAMHVAKCDREIAELVRFCVLVDALDEVEPLPDYVDGIAIASRRVPGAALEPFGPKPAVTERPSDELVERVLEGLRAPKPDAAPPWPWKLPLGPGMVSRPWSLASPPPRPESQILAELFTGLIRSAWDTGEQRALMAWCSWCADGDHVDCPACTCPCSTVAAVAA